MKDVYKSSEKKKGTDDKVTVPTASRASGGRDYNFSTPGKAPQNFAAFNSESPFSAMKPSVPTFSDAKKLEYFTP